MSVVWQPVQAWPQDWQAQWPAPWQDALAPAWQARWECAVESLGLPVFHMPSGAGHDAMKLHEIMPQAMLFTRGENAGISHNPLESTTSHDIDLCVQAFQSLLEQLATDPA